MYLYGLNSRCRTLKAAVCFFMPMSYRTVGQSTIIVMSYDSFLTLLPLDIFLLFRAGHTEQNISAIPSSLYGLEYFRCSEQVIRSRTFLLFRVGYNQYKISTFPSSLCEIECFCYSEQVIRSRIFLLFRVGYVEQIISAIKKQAPRSVL